MTLTLGRDIVCEESFTEEDRDPQHAGLYLLVADVTVYSHSGHPTRGCVPRLTISALYNSPVDIAGPKIKYSV